MFKRVYVGIAGVLFLAAGAAGCGASDAPSTLRGPAWQVVAIYTDPEVPGELPAAAAGTAHLAFGGASITGTTGCAALQGSVEFSDEGESVSADRASQVRITGISYDKQGDCTGELLYTHEQLQAILSPGATLDIQHVGPREVVLTLEGDAVNPPAIRMMAP